MGRIIDAVYKIESNKKIWVMKRELEILTREEVERQLNDISTFANEINGGAACGSIIQVEQVAETEFLITDDRPGLDVGDDGDKECTALKCEDDDGDKDSKPKATIQRKKQVLVQKMEKNQIKRKMKMNRDVPVLKRKCLQCTLINLLLRHISSDVLKHIKRHTKITATKTSQQ
jgi:hypothetical protein